MVVLGTWVTYWDVGHEPTVNIIPILPHICNCLWRCPSPKLFTLVNSLSPDDNSFYYCFYFTDEEIWHVMRKALPKSHMMQGTINERGNCSWFPCFLWNPCQLGLTIYHKSNAVNSLLLELNGVHSRHLLELNSIPHNCFLKTPMWSP